MFLEDREPGLQEEIVSLMTITLHKEERETRKNSYKRIERQVS